MEKHSALLNWIETFGLLSLAEKVYGPYEVGNIGRKIVIVVDDEGNRRTVSYPKWLMENHLGRKLDPDETIQHRDSYIDNNDLNNLEILPRSEHSAKDTRRVKLIDLTCDECGKSFQRSPRLLRDKNKKGVSGKFCGKACAGRFSRKLQLGLVEPLPPQPFMESEYFTHRDMQAVANELLAKYPFLSRG